MGGVQRDHDAAQAPAEEAAELARELSPTLLSHAEPGCGSWRRRSGRRGPGRWRRRAAPSRPPRRWARCATPRKRACLPGALSPRRRHSGRDRGAQRGRGSARRRRRAAPSRGVGAGAAPARAPRRAPPAPRRRLTGAGLDELTEREREIAELVCDRHTNRQIAGELFLSEKTIETHLRNIFVKLGVGSRVEVARAVERRRASQA